MGVHILNEQNSILNQFLQELRDVKVQNDQFRFQKNLERIGYIMAYEISKRLHYKKTVITTPLSDCEVELVEKPPVLATILRAGLPLHIGLNYFFDKSPSGFVSAYRKNTSPTEFEIVVEYRATPSLQEETLIISDPMLASGHSMFASYEALLKNGIPKQTHVAAVIGSKQGLEYVVNHFPKNTEFWIAALDDELNDKSYIVPGLGDAGDLAYGNKL